MKATKETLEQEIEYRIEILNKELKYWSKQPKDESNLYWFFVNEHSMHTEILELINFFSRDKFYKEIEKIKYTPLFCEKTNVPLLIGDKVEDNLGRCGELYFDNYTKEYVIRTKTGGNIHTKTFRKIKELYEFKIDVKCGECKRKNIMP